MRAIEYRQPVYRNGKFDHFHYWGLIELVGEGRKQWVGPLTAKMGVTDPQYSEQVTGLYDRNGVKVFEGDNVTINGKEYFIRFNMGVFVAESVTANHLSLLPWEFNGTDITVTGNLHEPATVRE